MAYRFGAGLGDDITWTMATSAGGSSSSILVCGWWYPTTLTATRGLWSCGNTFGAEIDATTDEIRLRTDNTTDGQWFTAGVDLVVDNWKFLAFLNTCNNTGPAAAWRVWAGSIESAPIACSITPDVTPVGNFTASASFYIGNRGTGTFAFQGDVGDVGVYATNTGFGAIQHPFSIATAGTITDTEANFVYERFVIPFWLGRGWANSGCLISGAAVAGVTADDVMYACTKNFFQVRRRQTVANSSFSGITPTINNAGWSQNGSPRPLLSDSPYLPAVRR